MGRSVRWKDKTIFLTACALFFGTLSCVNRMFFKQNSGFCISFLHSSLEKNPDWELPSLASKEEVFVDEILQQKFYYLAKGCHCYAFVSEDQKYVIKFHRFASHLRRFSWTYRPFSYLFNARRKKIKEHNLEKLSANFKSYKDSYSDLKEETGLLLLHINRSNNLHRSITLVDKMQNEYRVLLDDMTFILQRKADLIFPKLQALIRENRIEEAKQLVSAVIHLIVACSQKGYVDNDPVLKRNYGILDDRAIHIDVGDLIQRERIKLKENYIPHIKSVTEVLRQKLKNHPELLNHFNREIQNL
jgi:hypothetical protein